MIEFFQTPMGRTYYKYQIPALIKQLKRIADSMEKKPDILMTSPPCENFSAKDIEDAHRQNLPDVDELKKMAGSLGSGVKSEFDYLKERKPITKMMDELGAKGSGTFRKPNANELLLLRIRESARMRLGINSDEVKDVVESAKIIVIDYMPDSPGWGGPLIFISYGAAHEFYEVLRVMDDNTLESVEQAEEMRETPKRAQMAGSYSKEPPDPDVGHFDYLKETDQLKSFDIKETPSDRFKIGDPVLCNGEIDFIEKFLDGKDGYDVQLKNNGTQAWSSVYFIAAMVPDAMVPDAMVVKKYPPLKITRYTEEQAGEIDEISADFFAGGPNGGPIAAILQLDIPENGGALYITEHKNGKFWTEAGGDEIEGTLEECIEHLKCEFP